jgi:MOSC domain-containing protein YiiM
MSQYVGKVISLFISLSHTKQRTEKEKISVDSQGIIGDKFYSKDVQRSILLTSLESYALTQAHQITMAHGTLGENLLMDYNPYHLTPGTKLQIGEVLLEISQYCTICSHLSSIDKRVPELLKHDRGIFAKVLQGGSIKKEDKIIVLGA